MNTKQLKQWRSELGLSQAQGAELLGRIPETVELACIALEVIVYIVPQLSTTQGHTRMPLS
jgi:hypothetical protein